MYMTIFGIIWMLILLVCLFSKRLHAIIFLTILSSTIQCSNVFIIGETGVGPQVITSAAFVLKVIFQRNILKLKIRPKVLGIQVGMILLFLLVLFSSSANSVFQKNIFRVLQLFIYILCYFMMYKAGETLDDEFIYNLIRKITIILLTLGILQFLITSGIIPRLGIIQMLLYNDNLSDVVYFTRDNYYRILSTYMEPSYFAGFIVGAFYYFLSYKEKRKENRILLILILVELLLTFSSTAYGAFALTGILFLLSNKEGKLKIYILLAGIIGFLIMYFCFYNILDMVIFSKMESGSGIARHYYNRAAIRSFESSPIYGVGYKMSRGSSLFYTVLAELGISGLIVYMFTNMQLLLPFFSKRIRSNYSSQYLSISLAVISVVCCQLIAVPDLDICTYWMWMNLLSLAYVAKPQYIINKNLNV